MKIKFVNFKFINIKFIWLLVISLTIITFDQLTKLYIRDHFTVWESFNVVPRFFDITYVRNPGAAFGMLAKSPDHFRQPFFSLIPLIAVLVIIFILRTTPVKERLQIVGLSLVCGGAIGNYIDRMRFNYVVDFLYFHWKDVYYFPAFNVADSAICCGVGLLLIKLFFEKSVPSSAGVAT